jgi:carbamoyl-phosphate synthase large subunit
VIRALQAGGYRVVGVDVDGLAAGFRLAHDSALIPPAGDATFVEALCDVARATAASFLVPTMTEELIALHEAGAVLNGAGIAAWVPAPDAVETCLDKWRFAEVLRREGVSTPITNLGSADGVPGAWVVKPRFGRGSRDVLTVDRVDELQWALRRVPQPLVQTRLSGREFTADVLVDRDGTLAGAVPRWRLETRAGCSTKGRTFEDPGLVDELAKVVAAIGLQGPANVQGFIAADGSATFVEVNPRFSGGLPLSLAAGADLVGEYARAVLGDPIRRDRLAFRPGVTMIRRYEEVFE